MSKRGHMRHGSLQFWPRKRAKKILPSVSWSSLYNKQKTSGLLGFIGYKVVRTNFVRGNSIPCFSADSKERQNR